MQINTIRFLLFLNITTLLCSNQPNNASIEKDQDIFLNDARKALLTQAFESVRPQEKTHIGSLQAFSDMMKKKDTDKIFKTLRGLYSDDDSFFKAFAEKAQTEGFDGLAALTYQTSFVNHWTKKCFTVTELAVFTAGGMFIGILVSWAHVNFKK